MTRPRGALGGAEGAAGALLTLVPSGPGRAVAGREGPAGALLAVAHLRVEAIRVGLTEIVKLRNEVRLAPVDLAASQEVRLQRLRPKAVLRASEGAIFLPGREPLVPDILDFLSSLWPPAPEPAPAPSMSTSPS